MTHIIIIICILSGLLFALLLFCSMIAWANNDDERFDIFKYTFFALSVFFLSSILLYCGYHSNVRYTKIDVRVIDGRAFLFLDRQGTMVNLNELLKCNFKDGDTVYIRNSNLGPIEFSNIVRNSNE